MLAPLPVWSLGRRPVEFPPDDGGLRLENVSEWIVHGLRHELPKTPEQAHRFIDCIEARLADFPPADVPVSEHFLPGLYIRRRLIPRGTLGTSKIHRARHPFMITHGDITVWTLREGSVRLRGGHCGITEPGTRRILCAHEDTLWTTFHATDLTDPEEIEREIIEPHVNPFLALVPSVLSVP